MVDKKMYDQHEPSPGLAISSPALHFQGNMIHYYISAHQMKLINLRKQSRASIFGCPKRVIKISITKIIIYIMIEKKL